MNITKRTPKPVKGMIPYSTRIFGGNVYRFIHSTRDKKSSSRFSSTMRDAGYSTRVTVERNKQRMEFNGTGKYLVWIRR